MVAAGLDEDGISRAIEEIERRHQGFYSDNGDAKVVTVIQAPHDGLGLPLQLSDEDLTRLSTVTEADIPAAERFWRKAVDGTGLEDLLDAAPSEGGD
jgi:hypothetical protein